jgi:hypothetical protein
MKIFVFLWFFVCLFQSLAKGIYFFVFLINIYAIINIWFIKSIHFKISYLSFAISFVVLSYSFVCMDSLKEISPTYIWCKSSNILVGVTILTEANHKKILW